MVGDPSWRIEWLKLVWWRKNGSKFNNITHKREKHFSSPVAKTEVAIETQKMDQNNIYTPKERYSLDMLCQTYMKGSKFMKQNMEKVRGM